MAVRTDRHIDYNGIETRSISKYEYDMLAVCPADPTKTHELAD